MGPEGAVNIIYRRDIAASPTPDTRRQKLIDDYKAHFANPYVAAERGYIDDVIVPHETRPEGHHRARDAADQARAGPAAQARQHPAVTGAARAGSKKRPYGRFFEPALTARRSAPRPVASPGLERGRRDREVLDREPGGVEQRHRLRPRAPRRVAGEHRAELGHLLAGHEPGADGAGQLAAVRGLLPLVAEQRARGDRADARLGLAGAVGAEHVQVQAGAQVADVDHDLGAGGDAADDVAARAPRSRDPVVQPSSRASASAAVGARVVADARAVAGRRQAARRPRAVQSAADDPDGPRVRAASAGVATAATAPVRSAVTERASSSISGSPVFASDRQITPVTVGSPCAGLPGNEVIHLSSAKPSPRAGIARKSPNGGLSRYTFAGIAHSPAWWRSRPSRTRSIAVGARDRGEHCRGRGRGAMARLAHDTLVDPMNRRPKLTIVAPTASPEEAAAVVAALERFMRDTAPVPAPPAPEPNPWQRAALEEGVSRAPGEPAPWV